MSVELKPFDAADYLDDDETIREFIVAAFEENDPDYVPIALATASRARVRNGGADVEIGDAYKDVAAALRAFGLTLAVKAA